MTVIRSPSGAATSAKEAVAQVAHQLEQAQDEQLTLLRRLGDAERGGFGAALSGGNGWGEISRRLDLDRGKTRVDVPLGSLVAQGFGVPTGGSEVATSRAPLAQPAQDNRFLFPALPQRSLDDGVLAIVDFVQSGSRAVSGSIERDPMATTEKAELALALSAESEDVKQLAVTVSDVPEKLFAAEPALNGFLREEIGYALRVALDAYVVGALEGSAPPAGLTGANLVEQVRNALSAARANGANPSTLALSPADASGLDLTTVGSDGLYLFAVRDAGSSSPIWGLQVREAPSVSDPILIDGPLAATLYLGRATFSLDPYSGFKRDTVDARLEFEALAHVRDASGLYAISS